MQDLKVLLVQHDSFWQHPEANRDRIRTLIEEAERTDLIILPEMFSTGFSMESKQLAEPMEGATHRWMQEMASKTCSVICGSVIIEKSGEYLNRFLWVNPDGLTTTYDKRHLFRMADEHDFYSAGHLNVIIDLKGWKIKPQICYDLRFPVWARNKMIDGKHEYDVLINVANWPEARVNAWDTLLKARAIENHAYVVGVNRVGLDGNDIKYCGHSGIYDPKGNTLAFLDNKLVAYATNLNYADLARYRENFPAQLDADAFEIL
jgi:omega-amidase